MKGIVYTKFGSPDVLKVMEVAKPAPANNQVLIKVKACSMYYLDYSRFAKQIDGGKTPLFTRIMDTAMKSVGKVIGSEVSGIVEAVGKDVKNVKIGDEVFAATTGLTGGLAEYALADELTAYLKPSNLSFEEAATIPLAGITSLGAVRDAKLKAGQTVLIYGASGGVGQYLVQLSKAIGATVTAVCSTRNIKTAHKMGADYVIDYKREDFTKKGKTYDVIFAANGCNSMGKYKKLLNEGGTFITVGNTNQIMLCMMFGSLYSNKSKKLTSTNYFNTIKQPSLPYLKELVEENKIKPYVEKTYSAKDVAKAITHLCKDHAQGKIAFTMDL